jgi:hypothetical protein
MKTKQLFGYGMAFVLLTTAATQVAAADAAASARIKSVRIAQTNVVVDVEASGNFTKVTLESSARLGRRAWEPRGVKVLTNNEALANMTFTVPISPAIEILRVRADLAENTLPPTLYAGATNFAVAPGAAGPNFLGRGAADGGPGAPTAPAENTAPQTGDQPRSVVESDIWKLDGDTLFFFNQYRGLQVFDVAAPDSPVLTGTYDLPGSGEQMYVLNGTNVVLLARDNCSWFGSGNDSRVVLLQLRNGVPHLVKELPVPGTIAESRLVGSALYVIANSYERRFLMKGDAVAGEQWEWGSSIVSFDLADFSAAQEKSRVWVRGYGNAIMATEKFLFVAQQSYEGQTPPYMSIVHCYDISSARGEFTELSSFSAGGTVKDKFKMHVDGETFAVVVQIENWNATPRMVTQLNTFSLANPRTPTKLGSLKIKENEQLFATRFDGKRLYAVTYFIIDPVWIIDMTNPAAPQILGELEIPGFSTFLQPMGDKLLAIGRDFTDRTSRTAVQLFNVANAAKPELLSKVLIGDHYSGSEANQDEKAFGVLPGEKLVLVPFYASGVDGYSEGVQLIDLEADRLVKRGVVEHKMGPRRATVHRERLISISSRELLTVDITNRDKPAVVESLQLAWAADRLHLAGNYVLELDAYGNDGPALRVVEANDPSVMRSFLQLTNMPYMGSTELDGKLYVLQGRGAEYVYAKEPNPTNNLPIATNPAVFLLSTFDLSALPQLQLSSTTTKAAGETYFYGQYQPVLVKPDVLVWANKSIGYWLWRGGPFDVMPLAAADARAGAPVDSAMPSFWPWWGGSAGHFIAVDLSGATPSFASELKLTSTNGWWNFSDSFAANGLLYTSHQASEYDPNFDPPPQIWDCGGWDGTKYTITCTNDPPPGAWVTRYYLDVIDYSDPREPLVRKPVNVPGSLIGLHRNGEVVYTQGADFQRYWSYDQTIAASSYDGVNAHLIASLVLNQGWPPVLSDSGYVYIGAAPNTNNTNATIQVWTLSNAGKFEQVSSETLSAAPQQIEKVNDMVVVHSDQVELYDARNPADLALVGAGRAASCYGVLLEGADGEAARGLWLPVGWYGVIRIPVRTP